MTFLRSRYIAILALLGALGFGACQTTRNFTTYFNLFYNMERIMDEVEEELLYIREQKTPEPVYYVPFDDLERRDVKFYNHLERRSMNNEEMRANKVKLDSILIKGSKLMARDAKSDYLPDAVYYIGKTYFYEREWYQSQKKCEEFIAGFPESKWYPDAHLVLSMDLMQQGKVAEASVMLSRTIDVGWAHERRDILIDAFRLNADLQLGEGNFAEALRPYERAMVLSSDDEDKARWEYEIGLLYFRRQDFKGAIEAFNLAEKEYSPDILTQFQIGMQRAASERALGDYDEAAKQLAKLRSNGNYQPWYGLVDLEVLNLAATRPGGAAASDAELARVDSISPGKFYSSYAVYERAVRAFRGGDFKTALENFTKAKVSPAPFQRRAQRYASLLDRYFEQGGKANVLTQGFAPANYPDSLKPAVAEAYYNVARVFSSLDIRDSMLRYYDLSYTWSGVGSKEGARVIYARSTMARDSGRSNLADSLLEQIVSDYPLTEYAVDARKRLGYTEAEMIDTAKDIYSSGVSHMKVGENAQALAMFERLVMNFPKSSYAPRAYYAIGLLYEKTLDNLDSAYSYYGRLTDLYPTSDQALAVAPLLQAVNVHRMRTPHDNQPQNDGTGVNMDWMKDNPPNISDDEPDVLIPLNGDTSKLEHRPSSPKPNGAVKPSGAAPALPPGSGGGQQTPPANGRGTGTAPSGNPSGGNTPGGNTPGGTTPGGAAPSGNTPPGTTPTNPKSGGTTPDGTDKGKKSGVPKKP
ncbi:MAG: tetratricopeptide repeat protein [Bacteroidetes bacterium]|nr:tetratricopeptide repeat protein [Bacteroidota bacterium]